MGLSRAESLPVGMFAIDASILAARGYIGGRAEIAAKLNEGLAGYAAGQFGYRNGKADYSAMLGLRGRF